MRLPEEKIWEHINSDWSAMTLKQRRFWEAIKLLPEEWKLGPSGICWVVAIIGPTIVYYNHYECGFELSQWTQHGVIDDFGSIGYDLGTAIQRLIDLCESGYDTGPTLSGHFRPTRVRSN